jgi:hypothetical protein
MITRAAVTNLLLAATFQKAIITSLSSKPADSHIATTASSRERDAVFRESMAVAQVMAQSVLH